MTPRKIPGRREPLLQLAPQRLDDHSAGRMPVRPINSRENPAGSERAREDWSARLLELMLSR